MSIKNVVFDCGQVLVHFEPSYMVGIYVSDKEDKELLEKVVFDRLYWDKLDLGTITNEETVNEIKKRIPERLWDVSEKIYYNWIYNIPEIEGMRELVTKLRDEKGMRVFLLSNICTYFAAHESEISVLGEFEKCIYSAVVGHVKPNREIFEYLCDTCGILAEETVFVDDNAANIAGANAFGICGYLFDGDVEKLSGLFEKKL